MKRMICTPRLNWKESVEALGLYWHSNREYWNESNYYVFTMAEVLKIEKATETLHAMCLDAVQKVIDNKWYSRLNIPEYAIPLIEDSWNGDVPAIYGRFDLAYDGEGEPKMLEYNADTPTSLLEASVVQWHWLQELHPNNDQFNSIHEKLIDYWKMLKGYLKGDTLHFAHMDDMEDGMTVAYLRDTADQAGLKTKQLTMGQIGLTDDGWFTDQDDQTILSMFCLYPKEWLINEGKFSQAAISLGINMDIIEPYWKLILSNKGILAILWELYPDHPNLLRATLNESDTLLWDGIVKKPLLSREGANVSITLLDQPLIATEGEYGEGQFVYQDIASIPNMGGAFPVIGSWVCGQSASGMGIRESSHIISDNFAKFVPHLIEG